MDTTESDVSLDRHKYSKHKNFVSIVILIYIYQQLSNIWSSIHEEVKKHIEAELKKKRV